MEETRNKRVPEQLSSLLGEANAKLLAQQYADVKTRCQFIINKHPKLPDPYHLLGLTYQATGCHKEALNCFRIAAVLENKRASYNLWMEIGAYAEDIEEYTVAFDAYSEAVSLIKYTKTNSADEDTIKKDIDNENDIDNKKASKGKPEAWFYKGVNFESCEAKTRVACKLKWWKEEVNCLRYMLRNQENPSAKHLYRIAEIYESKDLTPYQLIKNIEPLIQPLLYQSSVKVSNESESISKNKSESRDHDVQSCVTHFYLFEIFLVNLVRNKDYKKALGFLTRFKLFLLKPSNSRFSYLNRAKPTSLPPVFLALQACCFIYLDKSNLAEQIVGILLASFTKKKEHRFSQNYFYYISDAYFEKGLHKQCLECLKKLKGNAEYLKGRAYDSMQMSREAIGHYEKFLKFKDKNMSEKSNSKNTIVESHADNGTFSESIGRDDEREEKNRTKISSTLCPFSGENVTVVRCASRLFEILWYEGETKRADSIYSKYILSKGEDLSLNKKRELQENAELEKKRKRFSERNLPLALCLEEPGLNEPSLKKSRIIPQFNANVSLRPATLRLIEKCKTCFDEENYDECLKIALDLLYPFFGRESDMGHTYSELVSKFPSDEGVKTYIEEDEAFRLAGFAVTALLKKDLKASAFDFLVELYKPGSYVQQKLNVSDRTKCFGFMIYLGLMNGNYENLAKELDELNLSKEKDNQPKIFPKLIPKLLILEHLILSSLSADEIQNVFRKMQRTIVRNNDSSNKNLSWQCAALIKRGLAFLKSDNSVKSLQDFTAAGKMSPDNPLIHFYLALCYLRFSCARTVQKYNRTLLTGWAHLEKFCQLRRKYTTSGQILAESLYNKGVYLGHAGITSGALESFNEALTIKEIPKMMKAQIALGATLCSYYKNNVPLAKQLIDEYCTV